MLHLPRAVCGAPCWHHRDLPQDLCPVYRPGEWEQLPSERDLNPFSRYEALDPKRPIVLDDLETGTVKPSASPTSEVLMYNCLKLDVLQSR